MLRLRRAVLLQAARGVRWRWPTTSWRRSPSRRRRRRRSATARASAPAGRAAHEGAAIETRHVAQVLARGAATATRAVTDTRDGHTLDGTTLRERTAEATPTTRVCGGALARAVDRFGDGTARGARHLEDPDEPAAGGARRSSAEIVAGLPELLERFADNVTRARRPRVLGGRRRPRRTRTSRRVATRIGARDGREVEVDGDRGDRPQRGARSGRLRGRRDRPRRVDHPARRTRRRATSSPRRCTSTGTRSHDVPAAAGDRRSIARRRAERARRLRPRAAARASSCAADIGITGVQLRGRRDRLDRARDERGQRPAGDVGAPRAHRGHGHGAHGRRRGSSSTCSSTCSPRSATGQHLSSYTNIITGPRREGEADGPDELHVVILDNGRSEHARHRVAGDADVHPLRRVPQRVPGVPPDRRPRATAGCTRGPIGRGADAAARRRPRGGGRAAERLDAVRRVHGRVPGRDPAAGPAARAARRRSAEADAVAERAAWKAWATAWSHPKSFRASMKVREHGPRARPVRRSCARTHAVDRRTRCAHARGPNLPRALEGRRHLMDRRVFLARVERQLATPAPAEPGAPDAAAARRPSPRSRSKLLDPNDLAASFQRAATAVSAEVHRIHGTEVPPELVAELVERYSVRRAVISAEPEERSGGRRASGARGRGRAAVASKPRPAPISVSRARLGLATTGTVVQESAVAGGGPRACCRRCTCACFLRARAWCRRRARCCARSAPRGGSRATSC